MRRETIAVAPRFVDLVLKHDWSDVRELPAEEIQVLFETVVAAGFDPGQVIPGKLSGNYRDQGGDRTGETYPINHLCPFKAVNREGEDYNFATGWLDCALRRIVYGAEKRREERDELVEAICIEIERSIPLQPIQLTPEGDQLEEYPPSPQHLAGLEYFVNHTRDSTALDLTAGLHGYCGGWMDRVHATKMRDAIVCRRCHLRITFPKAVKTYGDFRRAMEGKFSPTMS